jgi:hypothetical protein
MNEGEQEAGQSSPALSRVTDVDSPLGGRSSPRVVRVPASVRLAAKVLQAHEVAKEIKRLGERGIRFLPKGKLDKQTIDMVNAWCTKLSDSSKASDNLLIAGMDHAEKGVKSIKDFNTLKRQIIESSKLGLNNLPGLWPRQVWFNPQVAGELLKLAFTLNRSLSFTVHLVLLYGLESLAEELSTVGPHPPNEIGSPSRELAQNQKQAVRNDVQKERDEAFYARNPTFDSDKRLKPYTVPAELEPKSKAEGYNYGKSNNW